ncbi:MAG: hypothetical protein RLZZ122_753 [Actinomycetota bacterium]
MVFPSAERLAANAKAGDSVEVTLELDSGYRTIDMHPQLEAALSKSDLAEVFSRLSYSKRKEIARQVNEAKAEATRQRRIEKVLEEVKTEKPFK